MHVFNKCTYILIPILLEFVPKTPHSTKQQSPAICESTLEHHMELQYLQMR